MALALLTNAILGAVLQKLFQSEPKAETCSYRSGLPPELHLLLEDAESGRVPGSSGKLDQFSPGSSLSPAALGMFRNATGTALADTISSLQRVFLSSCSLTANSHISLCCTVHCIRKVLQDQSCLCGLPCCFMKMIIRVATGLSKSKHAFGSACLHKTCCYSCAARTL